MGVRVQSRPRQAEACRVVIVSRAFWVPHVVAKGRPRLARDGRVYTPKRTHKFEQEVCWLAREAGYRAISGPVHIMIRVVLTPPTGWRKADREVSVGCWADDSRIDLDNILKGVCDGLNGVAYIDDHQVCSITATKIWGDTAGIWIQVRPLDDSEMEVK